MDSWDGDLRPVRRGYEPATVQKICVQDRWWQEFRLSMKGKPTRIKLDMCAMWYDGETAHSAERTKWEREVQVGNYLGALRRGGQLDDSNQVRKYI
jgi:hypothetical protein